MTFSTARRAILRRRWLEDGIERLHANKLLSTLGQTSCVYCFLSSFRFCRTFGFWEYFQSSYNHVDQRSTCEGSGRGLAKYQRADESKRDYSKTEMLTVEAEQLFI